MLDGRIPAGFLLLLLVLAQTSLAQRGRDGDSNHRRREELESLHFNIIDATKEVTDIQREVDEMNGVGNPNPTRRRYYTFAGSKSGGDEDDDINNILRDSLMVSFCCSLSGEMEKGCCSLTFLKLILPLFYPLPE